MVILVVMVFCCIFVVIAGLIENNIIRSMNKDISAAINHPFQAKGRIYPSSSIAHGIISDGRMEFFYKIGSMRNWEALKSEFESIKFIAETNTIRVPKAICKNIVDDSAYIVFEMLNFSPPSNPALFAEKLVQMHRVTSSNSKFGFSINNTIGDTFQSNNWEGSWPEFWDKHRLGHMFNLVKLKGLTFKYEDEIRCKVSSILSKYHVVPSLVHGDLWSGNQGFVNGEPVIYDPAAYFGDRDVDIGTNCMLLFAQPLLIYSHLINQAMTKLFGSNSEAFYQAYDKLWSREKEDQDLKEDIYNSYHLLNHYVLFGGSYAAQADRLFQKILKS